MKRIISIVLTILMLLTLFPANVFAQTAVVPVPDSQGNSAFASEDSTIIDSGTCGENLTWTLYSSGTLVISGEGEMTDYDSNSAPWIDLDLTKVVIENGVTTIGNRAFSNCESLTDVIIPETVINIGESAFSNCIGLTSLTVSESSDDSNSDESFNSSELEGSIDVERPSIWSINRNDSSSGSVSGASIGDYAFYNCTNLTNITIPDAVTSIGDYAFYNCNGLTSVTIPDSVISIGDYAFEGCIGLTSITIPEGVTFLGEGAFINCTGITTVNFNAKQCATISGINIDNVFGLNESITTVNIGDGVTTIPGNLFSGLDSVTSITIPDSVKTIEAYAFNGCYNLTNITMPVSVSSIGHDAFYYCRKLANVYYGGTETDRNSMTFEASNSELVYDATWHYNSCIGSAEHTYANTSDATCNNCSYTRNIAKITKQPTNVLIENGKSFAVKVTAGGDGLTFKWYYKDKGMSSFAYTSTFTSNTYSTTMTAARNGRQVYCVITDKYGNKVTSKTVTLSLKTVAKITKQPANVLVESGKSFVVKVNAVGDGLTYKWYYKDKGATTFSYTSTFTTNTYSTTMTAARNGRQVYCVITDKYGNKVKSNTVTLSLKTVAKITKQPSNVLVENGKSFAVKVTAVGDGLTYKWYYKDKGVKNFTYTPTFTGNTYSTTMTAARNGRQVYCVVTDKYGNSVKTNTVTLSLKTVAKITKQPVSVTVANGKNATVTVKAVGDGLTYKWYYKESWGKTFTLTNSFKGNTYTVTMNDLRNGRQLYCVVTDKYGNKVKSNTVTIGMKTPAKIKYSPANAYVKKNANAKFSVTATGDGLKYQWQVKISASAAWKNTTIQGYNTKTITVAATAARKGYKYRCIVTDKYGNKVTSGTATLYIN